MKPHLADLSPFEAPLLEESALALDALVAARELLGCLLVRDGVVLRITELEAGEKT